MNEETEYHLEVPPGSLTVNSGDLENVSLKAAANIIKAYVDQNDVSTEEFDDLHEAWSIAEYYHNRPPAEEDD
jgi:predicted transcriptional regulator